MAQWCAIAPIYNFQIDPSLSESLESSKDVRLSTIPDWVKGEEFTKNLNSIQ
jgi:hypothetical protein